MYASVADDPLGRHVLDELEDAGILANGADGDAARGVEVRVLDEQVRRVRFGGERVVAPGHVPAAEGDVVRVECVDAVGIDGACLVNGPGSQ